MLINLLASSSVATSLFIVALLLHPRTSLEPIKAQVRLWLPLVLAMLTIHLIPQFLGTERFTNNLLWMHGLLAVPLITTPEKGILDIPFSTLYTGLIGVAGAIHIPNTFRLLRVLPKDRSVITHLYQTTFTHPARSAVHLDVAWVVITLSLWYLTSGSSTSMAIKAFLLILLGITLLIIQTGVNSMFIASLVPIIILAGVGALSSGLQWIRSRNVERRRNLLESMGIAENSMVAGTNEKPPSRSGRRKVVGFWHPYW